MLYLGKNGKITAMMKEMRLLAKEVKTNFLASISCYWGDDGGSEKIA